MLKTCTVCTLAFSTKDSRQKSCSTKCGDELRSRWHLNKDIVVGAKEVSPSIKPQDLPPPEMLPAPYAKRVFDMWVALTGSNESTTRIA